MIAGFFLGAYVGGFFVSASMTKGDLTNILVSAAVWPVFVPYVWLSSR